MEKREAIAATSFVLAPKPVARGCFALLVPGNMKWDVSEIAEEAFDVLAGLLLGVQLLWH